MLGCRDHGEVREWLKRPVSKTGIPKGIGSSNLPLSANEDRRKAAFHLRRGVLLGAGRGRFEDLVSIF